MLLLLLKFLWFHDVKLMLLFIGASILLRVPGRYNLLRLLVLTEVMLQLMRIQALSRVIVGVIIICSLNLLLMCIVVLMLTLMIRSFFLQNLIGANYLRRTGHVGGIALLLRLIKILLLQQGLIVFLLL